MSDINFDEIDVEEDPNVEPPEPDVDPDDVDLSDFTDADGVGGVGE